MHKPGVTKKPPVLLLISESLHSFYPLSYSTSERLTVLVKTSDKRLATRVYQIRETCLLSPFQQWQSSFACCSNAYDMRVLPWKQAKSFGPLLNTSLADNSAQIQTPTHTEYQQIHNYTLKPGKM